MGSKLFLIIIVLIVAGTVTFIKVSKSRNPVPPRPGVEHADNGSKHVEAKEYGGGEPPTSGDHASPVPWQAYDQEIPDANVIHNMEHGGIYISYRPDLSAEDISKIKNLFTEPFSRKDFKPSKAVVAPRAANEAPIVMSSWTRSESFEVFDEEKMVAYYKRNIGKSPEPTAN